MPRYIVESLNRETGERFDFTCAADNPAEAKLKAKAHNLDPIRAIESGAEPLPAVVQSKAESRAFAYFMVGILFIVALIIHSHYFAGLLGEVITESIRAAIN